MTMAGSGGSEDRKKMFAVGGFLLVAGAVLYFELRDTGAPAVPAPAPVVVAIAPAGSSGNRVAARPGAVSGNAAKAVGVTSAALDPTLHMEAMLVSESVVYSGSGRNIFSANSAPPPIAIPKPISSARITAPPPVVQPCPPNCPPPPPPPPIDLKFFGVETSANGARQAFLLHGDDVFLALTGDIVLRRYRVISIEAKTIQVEDLQSHNRQTLPLLAN